MAGIGDRVEVFFETWEKRRTGEMPEIDISATCEPCGVQVLISGPTGVGQTFLACTFAQKACHEGFRAFYIRASQFFYQIALARADGSYGTLMKRFSKTDLLVLDDLGLAPLTDTERRDLLEVIEDRTGSTSTLITSQLPIDHWHDHIGNPTIADAIMDRLIHNAHRIQLKGGSMRKKQKLDANQGIDHY